MNRAITVLAALLALQLGVLGLRSLGGDTPSDSWGQGGKLIPGVAKDQVAQITIEDKNGKSITLAREGKGFVVQSAGSYPCDEKKAEDLLDLLLGLRSQSVVARNPKSHGRFEVSDQGADRTVWLKDAGGKVIARLLVGRSAGSGQFCRLAKEPTVHRVTESLTWRCSTRASSYVSTQLIDFKIDKVEKLAWLEKGKETLALERFVPEGKKEKAWRATAPAAFACDKSKVETILRSFGSLRFSEPVAAKALPEHGLTPAGHQVVATLEGGEKVTLELGAEKDKETHSVFARLKGKPFVVEVPKWTVDQVLKTAADVQPDLPKTPAPKPGAGAGAGAVPKPGAGAGAAPKLGAGVAPKPGAAAAPKAGAPEAPKPAAPASKTAAPKTTPAAPKAPAPKTTAPKTAPAAPKPTAPKAVPAAPKAAAPKGGS